MTRDHFSLPEPFRMQDDGQGAAPESYDSGQAFAPIQPPSTEKPKKKGRLKVFIIAGALLLAAATVTLTLVLTEAARSQRYEEAILQMDSGNVLEAREVFLDLGEYKESISLAQECRDIYDYREADVLMAAKDWAGAKQVYLGLGSYRSSESLAQECQDNMDYEAAQALFDAGSMEEAKKAFLALGSFSDSGVRAKECQNEIDYTEAVALMDSGSLIEAKAIFNTLGNYKESSALSTECANKYDYNTATAYFENGEFFSAYVLFYDLSNSGYLDSADKAAACIQEKPKPGQLYRNPDFAKKSCLIYFKTPKDDYSTYLKIYDKNGILVSTLFTTGGKKISVKLPSGSYTIKEAVGLDWFGEKEMFGDVAYYGKMVFDDGEYLVCKSSYYWTITLRSEKGEGNIALEEEDREDF